MQKKTGVHFYINIANFDDVAEKEEAVTHEVRHSEIGMINRTQSIKKVKCFFEMDGSK